MQAKLALPLAALALGLSCAAGAASPAHNHADGGEARELRLDAGRQWHTDRPLRQAMGRINQALTGALPAIHGDRFSDADYDNLAATVRQEVSYAVANCKLEPRADAMLHLVIADLLAGADAMAGKAAASRHDGAGRVLHALQAYGKYFRHPGWRTPG